LFESLKSKDTQSAVKLVGAPKLPESPLSFKERELQKTGGGIIVQIEQIELGNMSRENSIAISAYFASSDDVEIVTDEASSLIMGPKPAKVDLLTVGFESINTKMQMIDFVRSSGLKQKSSDLQ